MRKLCNSAEKEWLFIIWPIYSSDVNNVDTQFINLDKRAFRGF
ncbi:MAG: hypothetical protein ACXADY_03780 [Candidatus Hodarchaeales archaeon]